MAGELASFGIQKLWNLVSREHKQFQGVTDQVTELQTDLTTLKSFLKDADAKKHTSEVVKKFIEEIKKIVFDAEDIIETFILKDELRINGGIKKRIRRLSCILQERMDIASDMRGINKMISKVIRDMQSFGVQRIIDDCRDPQPFQQRIEFARKYEGNLVGLEENVDKLVGYLVEEDDVQVVSITGMGGLGKTTLARQAFNHDMVISKFDRVLWVCVTQVCDSMNVWRTILRTLKPSEEEEKISKMTKASLQDELFRLLETYKSLVVFDDLWKEEDWDLIKPIFPHNKGSKVLFTSRNESVAGRGKTCINFKLEFLSDQDCWTLLQGIAMPSKDASELKNVDKEMEEMGKQMIKHCGGLPLAVKVLGGLLGSKYTMRDWKRISENIGSHLVGRNNDDNNNSFSRVLSLSFDELPGYLKYCFLYLAHFPKNYKICVEDLSYLWAAEGILRYDNGETILDVGHSYLEELVWRNMVIYERDATTLSFETCHLHDMMREIVLLKSKEENFLQIVGIRSPTTHPLSLCTSRRFVSHTTLHAERDINNSKARSLLVVWKDWDSYWKLVSLSFTRLQLLRVLHLASAKFKGKKLPSGIGKLIHLRYLNLENARISHLPFSLRNLKLLIYLSLNIEGESTFVPNVLTGMKELRFLALPSSMHKKTKLELSKLVNLETLINFSTENCSLEDLRGMAGLRTLGIFLTGERSLETLSALIGGLRHLENISIRYGEANKETKEWRSLFEFINLRHLKLSIDTPLLSDELQFPSRLTSLSLTASCLQEDPMPILEKLGQLKELHLGWNSFCGRRMVCSGGGFPELHKLEIWGIKEWEEWIVEEGSMPLLRTLEINYCKKLKELHDVLQFVTSLNQLYFLNMGKEWEERFSQGGEDYYKVQHIHSVRFCDDIWSSNVQLDYACRKSNGRMHDEVICYSLSLSQGEN